MKSSLSSAALTDELQFEKDLIDNLSSGTLATQAEINQGRMNNGNILRTKNWEYRPDLKTEEELWQNFKEITERHNQDVLEKPLSHTEFSQLKQVITSLSSPFKAGQFLYGLNGVSEAEIDLDDGRHVFLKIFDQNQVGAGETVYQVVNQVVRPAKIPGKRDRRFDVTLLINGLPIVQIELKGDGHPVSEALEQMRQYISENQYTGIFSTLQILVGMNPSDAKYMANTPAERFNTDFAFRWQNEKDNKPVLNWRKFSDSFLSIPMAHNMATTYMILDGEQNNESLKVMRSYQVFATQNVISSIKHRDLDARLNRLGYVWHTTGSGKTITSFKTAWLASKLPGVDKVVFLVDRKALTGQTRDKYRAYDPERTSESDGVIADTKNTWELAKKLKEKNKDIIVTTVQKLERLSSRKGFKAPDRRFVFVVDEAHRSTGGDAFSKIQKAFPNSSWIGYTGTPIFDSSTSRDSTPAVFGDCLHSYTIREAIADKNVLGFKVDYLTTLSEETIRDKYLPEFYRNEHPEWSEEIIEEKIANMTEADMDDSVSKTFYDMNPNHVREVVKDISNKWRNRSNNYKYNALLTTHVGGNVASTPMAMMYFREFQKINEEREAKGERRLKVAVTFSQDNSNSKNMLKTNEDLSEAIQIYNKEFGTNFDDTTVDLYREDLISRLNKTASDKNYLDLVIVVDQLLTGFDAPELNTLYVDRILKGANLIQAYSRTNRVADLQQKPFGQIVNYRWPKESEKLMNEALTVYANRANADVQGTLPGTENPEESDVKILAEDYKDLRDKAKIVVAELRILTDNFTDIPKSETKQLEMYDKLREYNGLVAKMKQYPIEDDADGFKEGFDYNNPDDLIRELGMSPEEENLLTTTLATQVKEVIARERHIDPTLIDLRMTFLKDVVVNYDYLTELLERLMNEVHEENMEAANKTLDEITKFADGLEDRNYARDIKDTGRAIINGHFVPEKSGLSYPYKLNDASEVTQLVKRASGIQFDVEMYDFRMKWGITDFVSSKEIREQIRYHVYGERDLNNDWLMDFIKKGQDVYKDIATDEEVRNMSKLRYRNELRNAVYNLADNQVQR